MASLSRAVPLLLFLAVSTAPTSPEPGGHSTLLYREPEGATPSGLLKGSLDLRVLEKRQDGWKRIAFEAWVPPEPRDDLAEAALDLVRRALEATDPPGLPLPCQARRVEQTAAEVRGAGTRIRWTVTARNRSRLPLADPRLEFRLLDRKGATLVRAEARCRSSLPLLPGEDGVWEVTTWLSQEQLKRYHRRRYRLLFYTPADS